MNSEELLKQLIVQIKKEYDDKCFRKIQVIEYLNFTYQKLRLCKKRNK